jgi:hypothetical protein
MSFNNSAGKGFRYLKISGLKYIQARYHPRNVPFYIAQAIFDSNDHAKYLQTVKRYDEMKQGILWWTAYQMPASAAKKVVRSWVKRRVKNAFKEALEANGIDSNGVSKVSGKARMAGTLELHANKATVTVDYETLKQQLDLLVKAMARKEENDDDAGPLWRVRHEVDPRRARNNHSNSSTYGRKTFNR